MSTPEPMRCHLDECPSPMACNAAGGCREAQKDFGKSWDLAISKSRELGIEDPFKPKQESMFGDAA